MICRIDQGEVRFISRNAQDWTDELRFLVEPMRGLPVKQAILDGEVVVLAPDGTTSFQALLGVSTLDVAHLKMGIYFVILGDKEGNGLLTKKLLVSGN